MISYIPFLKAKSGELTAMLELAPDVKRAICPLFDFPRKNPNYTVDAYTTTTRKITKSLKKHWGVDTEFYFDDLDISQILLVNGEDQYAYLLKSLKELQVIPIVGLDRVNHNAAVTRLKRNGEISSDTVAVRVEKSDFEDFDATEDQIDYDLEPVFREFKDIDLIFDCRLCVALDVSVTAQEIADFCRKFSSIYPIRRIIVTGSCIPSSIGDVLGTKESTILPRIELQLVAKARELVNMNIVWGDYATVSPFYSDKAIDPKLLQKITAPKLIYSFGDSHYVARGTSLATGGQEQYKDMTSNLCQKEFFRHGSSAGENYFITKSRGIGNNATNATVVKPSVIAHITYMVLGDKL